MPDILLPTFWFGSNICHVLRLPPFTAASQIYYFRILNSEIIPRNTQTFTPYVKKLLSGSLLTLRKNTLCVIPFTAVWPRSLTG